MDSYRVCTVDVLESPIASGARGPWQQRCGALHCHEEWCGCVTLNASRSPRKHSCVLRSHATSILIQERCSTYFLKHGLGALALSLWKSSFNTLHQIDRVLSPLAALTHLTSPCLFSESWQLSNTPSCYQYFLSNPCTSKVRDRRRPQTYEWFFGSLWWPKGTRGRIWPQFSDICPTVKENPWNKPQLEKRTSPRDRIRPSG